MSFPTISTKIGIVKQMYSILESNGITLPLLLKEGERKKSERIMTFLPKRGLI